MIFGFDTKSKNKFDIYVKLKKLLPNKGNHQQNEKADYLMGENISKA